MDRSINGVNHHKEIGTGTIPATVDNAVDVAVSLYLDIINLFIRILSILAKSKRS